MESKNNQPKYQYGQGASQSIPKSALRFDFAAIDIGDNGPDAKTAPVKMVARSGKPTEHWFWGNVVHDLSGFSHKNSIPIDYAHDPNEVMGYLNKFDTSSGDLVVSGALTPYKDHDRASEVLYKAKQGVPWQASINFGGDGIQVEEVPPGKNVPVNGYQFSGPGVVVRKWPLRGVAICPYGQDMNTSAEFNQSDQVNITIFQEPTQMSQSTPTEAAKTATPAVEVEKTITPAIEAKPATPPAAAVEMAQPKAATPPAPAAEAAPKAPAVEAPSKPGTEFVAAFGDIGARWFLEGKSFSACAAEFIAGERKRHDDAATALAAAHQTAIQAKDAEIADLKTKLAAIPRGNDPASFSSEATPKTGQPVVDEKLARNVGPNLARFAAGMKFAQPQLTTLPAGK